MPKSPDTPRFGERSTDGKVTPMPRAGVVQSLDEPSATEWARYLESQKLAHERRVDWVTKLWPPIILIAALGAPVVWLWRWATGQL